MQDNSNNWVFFQCVKLLIDSNIEMLRKSVAHVQHSANVDLEIVIFTCAQLMKAQVSKNNYREHKVKLKDTISWFFTQQAMFLPLDYFEKRLTEYIEDLEQISPENLVLPLYSYYSIVKSPLRQFEIEKVTDYDIFELLKFKLLIFHLEEMNSKSFEYLNNLVR
jgi:hypothetical protein